MKRFHFMLLVFAALVFTAVGCKRTSEKPRLPVEVVDAADFITPRPIDDTAEAFPKKARKDPPRADETPDQKKDRLALEAKDEAKAEEKEKVRRAGILEQVAKTYKSYFDTGMAKKLTEDDFKLRLTRAGFPKARKAMENRQVVLIMEAHPDFAKHIVAYWPEDASGEYQAAFINQTTGTVKSSDKELGRRKYEQVVETIYANFKVYAAQNQQKSLDQFKTYLQENAQPAVLKAVANQEVRVNVAAQIGNAGHLVACFAKSDPGLGASAPLFAVMGDGKTEAKDKAYVDGVFQQR